MRSLRVSSGPHLTASPGLARRCLDATPSHFVPVSEPNGYCGQSSSCCSWCLKHLRPPAFAATAQTCHDASKKTKKGREKKTPQAIHCHLSLFLHSEIPAYSSWGLKCWRGVIYVYVTYIYIYKYKYIYIYYIKPYYITSFYIILYIY